MVMGVMRTDEGHSSRAKSRGASQTPCQRPSTSLGTNEIWRVLESVPDPEIPVLSIVDLGIVREVTPERVAITPTYTGCPATIAIQADVRAALDKAGFGHVRIDTVLSPPWTTDWISEEGRAKLHAYGIAPPQRSEEHTSELQSLMRT